MHVCKTLTIGLLFFSSINADVIQGKKLFTEASCLECHNLEDFSNKKTKVKTFKSLHQRVEACTIVAEEEWFDDEVLDVAKYLNKDFYKLEKYYSELEKSSLELKK